MNINEKDYIDGVKKSTVASCGYWLDSREAGRKGADGRGVCSVDFMFYSNVSF